MSSSLWDDSTSEDEYDLEEDKDMSIINFVHIEKNKRPKHDGFVVGREYIQRRRLDGHNKLMLDYCAEE